MEADEGSPRIVVSFPRRSCFCLEDPHGLIVVCNSGLLWLTQSGDDADHLLIAGQECILRPVGTVLVQALRDSRCQLLHVDGKAGRTHIDHERRVLSWTPASQG
jgi:hypothetical protein